MDNVKQEQNNNAALSATDDKINSIVSHLAYIRCMFGVSNYVASLYEEELDALIARKMRLQSSKSY